jgi:hypothetical protein
VILVIGLSALIQSTFSPAALAEESSGYVIAPEYRPYSEDDLAAMFWKAASFPSSGQTSLNRWESTPRISFFSDAPPQEVETARLKNVIASIRHETRLTLPWNSGSLSDRSSIDYTSKNNIILIHAPWEMFRTLSAELKATSTVVGFSMVLGLDKLAADEAQRTTFRCPSAFHVEENVILNFVGIVNSSMSTQHQQTCLAALLLRGMGFAGTLPATVPTLLGRNPSEWQDIFPVDKLFLRVLYHKRMQGALPDHINNGVVRALIILNARKKS